MPWRKGGKKNGKREQANPLHAAGEVRRDVLRELRDASKALDAGDCDSALSAVGTAYRMLGESPRPENAARKRLQALLTAFDAKCGIGVGGIGGVGAKK